MSLKSWLGCVPNSVSSDIHSILDIVFCLSQCCFPSDERCFLLVCLLSKLESLFGLFSVCVCTDGWEVGNSYFWDIQLSGRGWDESMCHQTSTSIADLRSLAYTWISQCSLAPGALACPFDPGNNSYCSCTSSESGRWGELGGLCGCPLQNVYPPSRQNHTLLLASTSTSPHASLPCFLSVTEASGFGISAVFPLAFFTISGSTWCSILFLSVTLLELSTLSFL